MSAGPACPLCGGTTAKTLVRTWKDYRLYDCSDCGAGYCEPFQNPGPAYYAHNADVYGTALAKTTDPMSFEYDEALALLGRERTRGGRLLDVGCGAGGFLHRAKAAGLSVAGVEFNPERVAALRARGFEVHAESLPHFARRGPAPFDAVTLFELVEHLDAPGAWLDAAKSVLKPGGLLIVGTPNRDRAFDPFQGPGLEEIDNPPHHLTRWSAAALRGLLTRAGLEVEECRPLPYPLPLARLMLRNSLRLGLATKALGVDQLRHASAADASGPRAVHALVAVKEAALNAAAAAGYWPFRLACRLLGWQGATLLAAARRPG